MNILFVCRMLPHGLVRDSGRLDTYHYLRALAETERVSLISFVAAEDEQGTAEMETLCEHLVTVPFRNDLPSRLWRAWNRLWQPKVYGRNRSRRYARALRQLAATERFDVAIVDGMMAEYGRLLPNVPTLLDEVDIFATVAYHYYRQETRRLSRYWLKFDWLRTTARERGHWEQYDGLLVRSAKDAAIIREFVPEQRLLVLPPWFEGLEELMTIPQERPSVPMLLFVGAMNIAANVKAVTFFAEQVLPLIHAELPEAQFWIVGSQPTEEVQRLAARAGVRVTGDVPSLTPYYEKAAVVVVPLFTGGGIIVKTLNGLASGRPVVTTWVGNSGTGAKHERDLLVVSTEPEAMATAVLRLLDDETLWATVGENGRNYIIMHYRWGKIMSNLRGFLQTARKLT